MPHLRPVVASLSWTISKILPDRSGIAYIVLADNALRGKYTIFRNVISEILFLSSCKYIKWNVDGTLNHESSLTYNLYNVILWSAVPICSKRQNSFAVSCYTALIIADNVWITSDDYSRLVTSRWTDLHHTRQLQVSSIRVYAIVEEMATQSLLMGHVINAVARLEPETVSDLSIISDHHKSLSQ